MAGENTSCKAALFTPSLHSLSGSDNDLQAQAFNLEQCVGVPGHQPQHVFQRLGKSTCYCTAAMYFATRSDFVYRTVLSSALASSDTFGTVAVPGDAHQPDTRLLRQS